MMPAMSWTPLSSAITVIHGLEGIFLAIERKAALALNRAPG
jgi:hypothetical protein